MTAAILAGITALALVLRLLFLGQDSFWHDEIISVRLAQSSWGEFWSEVVRVPNMVFYHLWLRLWVPLGESEAVVRSLSVITAVLTVPAVYALGSRLFGVGTGLVAALLLTINVFHIQYSQEARSYSLLVLLLTLSSLFLVRSFESPSWKNWSGYAIFSALAIYSQNIGGLVLVAHGASLLFLSWREVPWKGLIGSWVAIGVLIAPLSFLASDTGTEYIQWIRGTSLESVYSIAVALSGIWPICAGDSCEMGGSSVFWLLVYFLPVIVACVIAVRKWVSSKVSLETWKYFLPVMWLFVPLLIALGISLLITPLFVPRYFIICLPPLVLLAAVGITKTQLWPRLRLPLVSTAILLAVMAVSIRAVIAYYPESEKEDWRGVASLTASQWQPGDGVLYYVPWVEKDVDYYLDRFEADPEKISPIIPKDDWTPFIYAEDPPDAEAIAEYLPDHYDRIWLVLSHDGGDRRAAAKELQEALYSKYQDSEVHKYLSVEVVLYSNPEVGVFGGQWKETTENAQVSEEDEWKNAAQLVVSQWQPGDGVLFYVPWVEEKFRVHLPGNGPGISSEVPRRDWQEFIHSPERPDRNEISEFLPQHFDRTWLVIAQTDSPDRLSTSNELQAALKSEYRNVEMTQSGRVMVALFSDPTPEG